MAFNVVDGGLDLPLPEVRRIRQRLDATREAPVRDAVAREMKVFDGRIRPGQTVAVGVGSRGVARIAEITRAVVDELKARGAKPYVVPAMGSHGGGTPEGQMEVLAGYGVTPETMGVPFRAEMDTVQIGVTPGGFPVHQSKAALEADFLLPVNRIKVHTDFHGPVESGLCKMLVIGYGKHTGAAVIHKRGFDTFHETIPAAARLILDTGKVLGGIATVENAREDVARIEAVPAERILAREPELLKMSRDLMATIPFGRLDVLVVDYLGKDVSGAGMDPNVTGRYSVRHIQDPRNPQKLVVLRLTERTHGNACGLGLADVTTRAVLENIDYQKYWTNIITSTELGGGKTPIWMMNDRDAIALAVATANRVEPATARLVRIESTLHLEEMWVSESLWQTEGQGRAGLEPLSDPQPMAFTAEGHLADLPLPAFRHGLAAWAGVR
ncbi:MAG TPA: lactate racemase domain-containing protein [Thermodesulfobacteriota bacterium]